MAFVETFITQIQEASILEWLAVIFGIAYVILITIKNILSWYFALASSIIYIWLCFIANLYIEAVLQFFYAIMAIIGWFMWQKEQKENLNTTTILPIIEWSIKTHLMNIGVSTFIFLSIGFIFDKYTLQASPYIDAFTTIFSLGATYMVAKRVLSNWIYWIAIDIIGCYLYYSKGYALTAVLYLVFTTMAIAGFFIWRKEYRITNQKK